MKGLEWDLVDLEKVSEKAWEEWVVELDLALDSVKDSVLFHISLLWVHFRPLVCRSHIQGYSANHLEIRSSSLGTKGLLNDQMFHWDCYREDGW